MFSHDNPNPNPNPPAHHPGSVLSMQPLPLGYVVYFFARTLVYFSVFSAFQVINLYQMTAEMWEDRIAACYAEHQGRTRYRQSSPAGSVLGP